MAEDFSYLDSFEHQYKPQSAFRPGIDVLSDGDYDFSITDASFDKVKNDDILRIGLLTSQGQKVEKAYWFSTNQQSFNSLCADLLLLGFDADKWGKQFDRPLAVELPKAVAKLKGLRFRARKQTRVSAKDNRSYHELHISGLIKPGSPPSLPAVPPSAKPTAPAPPMLNESSDEIPF